MEHHSSRPYYLILKNSSIVKPYTGNRNTREILKNFVQSQRARKAAYYLYSETATHIRSRKEGNGNKTEDQGKQMRTELRIQLTDWAVT